MSTVKSFPQVITFFKKKKLQPKSSSDICWWVKSGFFFPQQKAEPCFQEQNFFPLIWSKGQNQKCTNVCGKVCPHRAWLFGLYLNSIPGSPSGKSLVNMRPIDPSSSGPPSDGFLCWTSWKLSVQGGGNARVFWSWAPEDPEGEVPGSWRFDVIS